MGTGKTWLLKAMIKEHYMDKRILYLSHRVTFTNNIMGSFDELGFKSYLDRDYNADKLIIQIDSLPNLLKNGECETYDLIIMDEVESLLSHLSSTTLATKRIGICKMLESFISYQHYS